MKPDVGLRVVNFVYRHLQIDTEWSEWYERGFRWWPSHFAQRIWAEPPYEDNGLILARVHVQTDLLSDVPEEAIDGLAPHMGNASLCALVRGESLAVIRLASSFYVHDQLEESHNLLISLVAAFQADVGYRMRSLLALMTQSKPTRNAPTGREFRAQPDDIIQVVESQVIPAGKLPSGYAGAEFLQAAAWLEQQGFVTNADETGLASEIPFGEQTALLTLKSNSPHPELGNGLAGQLLLPMRFGANEATQAVGKALELNSREVRDHTDTQFFGSWCHTEHGLGFRFFLPNLIAAPGWVVNSAFTLTRRALWAARAFELAAEPHGPSMMDYAAGLAQLDDEAFQAVLDSLPPSPERENQIQALTAIRYAMRSQDERGENGGLGTIL